MNNRLILWLALTLTLAFTIKLISCKENDDCCVKRGSRKRSTCSNDYKSLIYYKGKRPFCKINRYLCKNLAADDAESNADLLIKTLAKLEKSSSSAVVKNPQLYDILEALTRSLRLRRQGKTCSAQVLMANLKDLPKLKLMFREEGNVTLDRIDTIMAGASFEYKSKCSGENILKRYYEHMRTLNRRKEEILLTCLDQLMRKQLSVVGNSFTKQHYRMSNYMINLRDQTAAKLLLNGLKTIGDEATVDYLRQDGRERRVSIRRINYILNRYVGTACGYFINHFKDLYPNLVRGEFDKFSVHLEPSSMHLRQNASEYFHHWILYDVCRLFTNELVHYPDPISKRIAQEINGYKFQEALDADIGYKIELETAIWLEEKE